VENSTLRYDEGTLLLSKGEANLTPADVPPWFFWDDRVDRWRSLAINYKKTLEWLRSRGIEFANTVPRYRGVEAQMKVGFEGVWAIRPYYYQEEALSAWLNNDCWGVMELPTGAGKTVVALSAIRHVGRSTLVVAPTIDLLNQWYDLLASSFNMEIGILGGGYHEVKEITVATYDSAYLYSADYGNYFGFLIFDEVHHLPSPSYSHIPELCIATKRLGLTATYERPDGSHERLNELVGPLVYRKSVDELAGSYLSEYELVKMHVELTPEEKEEYTREHKIYTDYLKAKNLKLFGGGWGKFVKLSAEDSEARRAMITLKRSREIALNASLKLKVLEMLLKRHFRDRVLIFTENNDLAYRISERHLLPAITHQTKTKERKKYLERFNSGEYPAIVTSKVLNEGVNIPEANVAIVLSGSGSSREHRQRLGRILRKREGKRAIMYEIVTSGTMERGVSMRRALRRSARKTGFQPS
jgi:superfamily II DNA or RNA helicase